LGHGNAGLINDPVIAALAEKHGKTAVQVILRWHLQMGFGFVPGSKSPEHIRENADIFDFALSDGDMEQIASLNKHEPFYKVTPESLQRLAATKCKFEE
ncbi:MAG: aldo/keto reductase, partial [Clostridia bacterium]|nr:aldo/keto reductase [Clostridia bacterium]